MNAKEIMKLINEVEREVKVEELCMDGIHIWPIIRIYLYWDMFNYHIYKSKLKNNIFYRIHWFLNKLLIVIKSVIIIFTDYKNNERNKKADYLFLSNGVSFLEFKNKWIEKNFDPIIYHLNKKNHSSIMLTPDVRKFYPRLTPSIYINLGLIYHYVLNRLLSLFNTNYKEKEELRTFIRLLKRKIEYITINEKSILKSLSTIKAYEAYFCRKIRIIKPKIGFLVDYYSTISWGYILACKKNKILTVEIQHGSQGDIHPAYGNWGRLPENGYSLLPNIFLVWSKYEADSINKWNKEVANDHRPVVVSNLLLQEIRSGMLLGESVSDDGYMKKHEKNNILITLQTGLFKDKYIELLVNAAKRTSNKYMWWIRLHPGMYTQFNEIKEIFRECTNVNIDYASKKPLYILLINTDVHITFTSSVVLEAKSFGIYSVVIHKLAIDTFPDEYENQTILYTEELNTLCKYIDIQMEKKKISENSVKDAENILQKGYKEIDDILKISSDIT